MRLEDVVGPNKITKPTYLYKYHSAPRVAQILRDCAFYFAPVSQLNDLYEFRVESLCTETPDSKHQVLARQLVHEGWYDTFEESLASVRKGDLDEMANDHYQYFKTMLQQQLKGVMKHTGVTCFSAERNNQRMWATYGDNHAGGLIEFTTSSESSSFAAHLMPAFYLKEKLDICPSVFLTDSGQLDTYILGALCCMKHWDWRDEREWRLLMLTNKEQSLGERIIKFERSAITRVFLGPRISPEHEKEVRKAAERCNPAVPVFKRNIDEREMHENVVGVEEIRSLDQLLYWADRNRRGS